MNRTLYHDTKAKGPFTPFSPNSDQPIASPNTEGAAYEAGLTIVGEFKTVRVIGKI
jgi:translation initiation factor 4E